eukprot:1336787-Prymnesium_polylepis.1
MPEAERPRPCESKYEKPFLRKRPPSSTPASRSVVSSEPSSDTLTSWKRPARPRDTHTPRDTHQVEAACATT